MKCSTKTTKKEFKPVTIELTFETQDELDQFVTLFNIPAITDTLSIGKEIFNAFVSFQSGYNLCEADPSFYGSVVKKIAEHPSIKGYTGR